MFELPEFLCNRPAGFAEWWVERFGCEALATQDEEDNFVMAILAWEAAVDRAHARWHRAVGMSLEAVEELAAEQAAEVPDEPIVCHTHP